MFFGVEPYLIGFSSFLSEDLYDVSSPVGSEFKATRQEALKAVSDFTSAVVEETTLKARLAKDAVSNIVERALSSAALASESHLRAGTAFKDLLTATLSQDRLAARFAVRNAFVTAQKAAEDASNQACEVACLIELANCSVARGKSSIERTSRLGLNVFSYHFVNVDAIGDAERVRAAAAQVFIAAKSAVCASAECFLIDAATVDILSSIEDGRSSLVTFIASSIRETFSVKSAVNSSMNDSYAKVIHFVDSARLAADSAQAAAIFCRTQLKCASDTTGSFFSMLKPAFSLRNRVGFLLPASLGISSLVFSATAHADIAFNEMNAAVRASTLAKLGYDYASLTMSSEETTIFCSHMNAVDEAASRAVLAGQEAAIALDHMISFVKVISAVGCNPGVLSERSDVSVDLVEAPVFETFEGSFRST